MSRQEITEELDARIRRAYARGSNYYLVAQHDRATDFSYIVDIGKDLYEFASYNKPVVTMMVLTKLHTLYPKSTKRSIT